MADVGAIFLLVGILLGCGSQGGPPVAGTTFGALPDLRGHRVMVFPVQIVTGVPGNVDGELGFALSSRGGDVEWQFPERLRRVAERAPGSDLRVTGLPVGVFLRAEVRRVGDPLFGYLLRMAAITGAELAILPVEARFRPASERGAAGIELAVAMINSRNGRVLWYGVVEGDPGEADDPRALASAADEVAKLLTWWNDVMRER